VRAMPLVCVADVRISKIALQPVEGVKGLGSGEPQRYSARRGTEDSTVSEPGAK
jgi:hypothetical protein